VSGRSWPSRAASRWVHRKAEEGPIVELSATTTPPRGARLDDAQQAEDLPDTPKDTPSVCVPRLAVWTQPERE